jgi:hypothetical protein
MSALCRFYRFVISQCRDLLNTDPVLLGYLPIAIAPLSIHVLNHLAYLSRDTANYESNIAVPALSYNPTFLGLLQR